MNRFTLAGALEAACARYSTRRALLWQGQDISYAELAEATTRVSSAYRAMGITRGERVVCHLPNQPELLISAIAAWRCGAIHCGADPDLTPAELLSRIERIGAAALVTQPATAGYGHPNLIRQVRDALPRLPVIVVGQAEGCLSWNSLVEPPARPPEPGGPEPGDPALLLFTSGTTAAPKVVVRYHEQLTAGWASLGKAFGAREGDVHLAHLPLSHGFGFGLAVVGLLTGGNLALVERFSPEIILSLISEESVNILHGSPAHFALLLDRLELSRHQVTSLRVGVGSAAGFPRTLLEGIFERLGMGLLLAYGSSEGLGWSTTEPEEMLRGSVGRTSANAVRIVASDGAPVSVGEIGEIQLRKAHPVHYWDGPGAVFVDPGDWYSTGDLGRLDGDRRLYVLGRVRHQVNRGGIRIDPTELESMLARHPGLADAAVVGLPHPLLGEIVCVCVIPGSREPAELRELRSFLGATLARHKLPEELCVVPEIPRTALGKIDRMGLRALAEASGSRQRLRDR